MCAPSSQLGPVLQCKPMKPEKLHFCWCHQPRGHRLQATIAQGMPTHMARPPGCKASGPPGRIFRRAGAVRFLPCSFAVPLRQQQQQCVYQFLWHVAPLETWHGPMPCKSPLVCAVGAHMHMLGATFVSLRPPVRVARYCMEACCSGAMWPGHFFFETDKATEAKDHPSLHGLAKDRCCPCVGRPRPCHTVQGQSLRCISAPALHGVQLGATRASNQHGHPHTCSAQSLVQWGGAGVLVVGQGALKNGADGLPMAVRRAISRGSRF